ncbi:MAG: hypothetical protein COA99_19530 [Moraxellaceae bacterium]|nr:MAG: hypothetical protein COA99_19530 [Moraxellaceae bacterium]
MTIFAGPLFILQKGLFDYWFNYALCMTNISLFFSLLLVIITLKFSNKNNFIKYKFMSIMRPVKLKKNRMLFSSIFFLLLFFLTFILLTRDFGLLNWIANPREGYQLHRVGNGQWYALSLLFLSVSFTLIMVYTKTVLKTIFVFFFYAFLIFFLGSKGFVLSYFIFFLIILWYRKSKYFKKLFLILPPIGFFLLILNFNPNNLADIFKYFDHYINSAMYYEAYSKGEIKLYYGYIWISDFYHYLPRILFPDKPYIYGLLHVNEFFWPGAAELTNTPAFGGPLAAFADFGILGVLLSSLFNLSLFVEIIFYFILYRDNSLNNIRENSNKLYLFIWILAPSFMIFFGSLYMIILFILIIKIIATFNKLKIGFK